MNNKLSPIIIIVSIIALIVIGVMGFKMLSSTPGESGTGKNNSKEDLIKPKLSLSLDNQEENQEEVTILASATTEDEDGIATIILPDGTEIQSDSATFTVTENDNYTFKVIGVNGAETSISINVSNIKQVSATNPYIPNGFKHVQETTVEDGFVIEDSYGNQYVWIPVSSGKLIRNTMLDYDYEESNSTASALVNSVAKYYGFYIGKYEASEFELNGEKVAASMEGKIPWTSVTFQEASEYAINSARMFEYEDANTAILNSYAWDTLLSWIDESITNYSSNTNYGNYSGSIYPTGTTETDNIKNICDIAGNVREWTTEIYKKTTGNKNTNIVSRVVRGGSANLSRTPASHIGYPENTSDAYWGFRMILYK